MTNEPDPRVSSIPLDTEDGGQVVIEQQNAGPGNQVGGGEFKNSRGRSVEDAEADQEQLEAEAPVEDTSTNAEQAPMPPAADLDE